jgi:hypothetical protein
MTLVRSTGKPEASVLPGYANAPTFGRMPNADGCQIWQGCG